MTAKQPTHPCAGQVHQPFGVDFYSCPNRGRYHEDGKWWCGTHRPSAEAARKAKRDDAYREKRAQANRLAVRAEKLGERAACHVGVDYDYRGKPTESVVLRATELDRLLREAGR